MRSLKYTVPVAAAVLVAAGPASAATDRYVAGFTVPAFYGAANTTYQEWNGFSAPAGPNAPTAATNAAGTANWLDRAAATDGAFLIGTAPNGHVYSSSGTVVPEATVPVPVAGARFTTTLVYQTEVAGTGLDTTSFALTGGGTTVAPSAVVYTSTPITGGFGGTTFDYTVTFAGLPATAAGYTLDYAALGTSASQVTARLDTLTGPAAVPEPASAAAVALAGLAAAGRRRRRA